MAATAAAAAASVAVVAAAAAAPATPAAANAGNMGYHEGLIMLQQHIKKSNQTMEAVRVDLREFLLQNKEAQLPTGGPTLPSGGGIPKPGARIPGNGSIVKVANDE